MTVRRGMSILDLLPMTTGLVSAVPDGILEQIAILNIVDHRSTVSPGFYLHEGTLQSVADQFDLNTANWLISVPGVSSGLPFRLAITRAPAPGTPVAGAPFIQEAAPGQWAIDIDVNPVTVVLPMLNAATIDSSDPLKTPSLTPVGGNAAARRVTLNASCVLRVSGGGPAGTQVQLVDAPDPLDPNAPSGATVRVNMQPNTAVIGNSQFGFKLDTLVADLSTSFTPADIEARGKDEGFVGISLKELSLFLPINTPAVDNLTVSGRDLLIGVPFGMQGEIAADFSKDYPDSLKGYVTVFQLDDDGDISTVAGSDAGATPPMLQYPIATTAATAGLRQVRAVFDIDNASIDGVADVKVVGVWWQIPGGAEGNSAATPWFMAPTDALLQYRLRIADATLVEQPAEQLAPPSSIPSGQTELQQVAIRFPRLAGSPDGAPPVIDAVAGAGPVRHNVLHLRGTAPLLRTVRLSTRNQAIKVRWSLGGGSAPVMLPSSTSFDLAVLPNGRGPFDLLVTDNDGEPGDTKGVRRIRIDVVAAGLLAIGHQLDGNPASPGVVTLEGELAPVPPQRVSDTFLARPYHANGARPTAPRRATLQGAQVVSEQGTATEVEIVVASGENAPVVVPVAQTVNATHTVQILYVYGEDTPTALKREDEQVTQAPPGQNLNRHQAMAWPMAINFDGRPPVAGSTLDQQIAHWVAELDSDYPGLERSYFVVGRTDDLWYGSTAAVNLQNNQALADRRKERAMQALLRVVGNPAQVMGRREDAPGAGWPATGPARMTAVGRLALPAGNAPDGQPYLQAGPNGAPVWRHDWTADGIDNGTSTRHAEAKADKDREGYRCAEVFAIIAGQIPPAPVPPAPANGTTSRVAMLVPGPDGPITALVVNSPKGANSDFRIAVKVRWDSSSATGAADFIPTLAEAKVRWRPSDSVLPALGGGQPPTAVSTVPGGPDYWEVLLAWTYDATTGQTAATGALSLPKGKLQVISDVWACGLAFGPPLAAKLDEGDITGSEAGDFVSGVACIAAGAAIGLFINKDAVAGEHHGSVIFDKFTISYRWNGAPHAAATTDYTVDLRIHTGIAGVFSVQGNLSMAYKGVGVIFDGANTGGIGDISLCMDNLAVTVVDPGTWSLGGPLGNLIRIAASRMGNGSDWMEFDLEFALDLGVIRLEGATIRMRFESDPAHSAVELRGLTAVVEVPGTLSGKGSATIGDGGAFRAMLMIDVIPAKLSAYGAIAVDQEFVAVEVGLQLPVGIPLGGTGFGLFGFMGRFVANGTRDLTTCTHPDPVERQLQWYGLQPDKKYKPLSGQFAFGVGAVIGTLPDGGFSFNAEGALTLGFPDISVVFSIDAHLITQRKSAATSQGDNTASETRILGMVVIEPEAIMLAVRTTYTIPNLLKLEIPISAYFPLAGSGAGWYIHIGSDGWVGREGAPVTLVLFPEVLDVKAWAFVMFHEKGLEHLGGNLIPQWANIPSLDFSGFAIGMGAGFDLHWSAGPLSLDISAFLVVGLGTKPLLCAGAAGVAGSLDLVVISLDVSGWLYFRIEEGKDPFAKGHFCASVDCFFFSIEGCVDITIGNDGSNVIPPPASPISGLDLVDHLAVVKGRAVAPDQGELPVVWPDTIGVLKFSHYTADVADGTGGFVRKVAAPAALTPWSGSTQLKYAYRLTALELLKWDGAQWQSVAGTFNSAWWLPTHRAGIIEAALDGVPPSTEEGRELGLWTMDPAPWSRWLTAESKDVPGNPVNTVGKLCEPSPAALPSCAFGRDRAWTYSGFGQFAATPPQGTPYPSHFKVVARLASDQTVAQLVALASASGYHYEPGAVVALAGVVDHGGYQVQQGWRFPHFRRQGMMAATASVAFDLSTAVLEGEMLLQLCVESGAQRPQENTHHRVCDRMPEKEGEYDGFDGASGAHYEGRMMVGRNGNAWFAALREKFHGVLARAGVKQVSEVAVEVELRDGSVLLVALDADGKILDRLQSKGTQRQWLTIRQAGIAQIVLDVHGVALLYTVCWGEQSQEPVSLYDLMPVATGRWPAVVAIDENGLRSVLAPEAMKPAEMITKRLTCQLMRYALPATGPGKAWVSVEVAPWYRGNVTMVALCGLTQQAWQSQQEDQAFKDKLKETLVEQGEAVQNGMPGTAVALEADSRYLVRVSWDYLGWHGSNPGDDAPAIGPGATWNTGGVEQFAFATAAFGQRDPATLPSAQTTTLDLDPAQGGPGYDERSFDPRGLARYLTNSYPTHEDPPHFLDDPMGFWFRVDHLQSLVARYDGRELKVKVYHTRPKAGSLKGTSMHVDGTRHVLDVTLDDPALPSFVVGNPAWRMTTDAWTVIDAQVAVTIGGLPCIGVNPGSGASKVTVQADLQPASEYDLLLNTVKPGDSAVPEVLVTRSHFRTSRYRNPGELLAGLGFAALAGGHTPNDAITTFSLAGKYGSLATPAVGDDALDEALRLCGMDPWPLPAGPRTTVVWRQTGVPATPWEIAGVLLEADEPVWRAGMRTGALNEPEPPPRLDVATLAIYRTSDRVLPGRGKSPVLTSRKQFGSDLRAAVRNTAGTRLLFVAGAVAARPNAGGRLYDMALQLRENGAPGASGVTAIFNRPAIVALEL